MNDIEVLFKKLIVLSLSDYVAYLKHVIVKSLLQKSQPLPCKFSLYQYLRSHFYELLACERLLRQLLVWFVISLIHRSVESHHKHTKIYEWEQWPLFTV